jgi:hypothetical protein
MTENDLELAYLRAMQEWITEEHNTRMIVMQRDATRFPAQVKKEEAALAKYRQAQMEFLEGVHHNGSFVQHEKTD